MFKSNNNNTSNYDASKEETFYVGVQDSKDSFVVTTTAGYHGLIDEEKMRSLLTNKRGMTSFVKEDKIDGTAKLGLEVKFNGTRVARLNSSTPGIRLEEEGTPKRIGNAANARVFKQLSLNELVDMF